MGLNRTGSAGAGSNFIQSNLAQAPVVSDTSAESATTGHRAKDPRIVAHERRRAVEAAIYDLRLKLEAQDLEPAAIESQLQKERKRLETTRAQCTDSVSGLNY